MPRMFKPKGNNRFFDRASQGEAEGYFLTYNDMANAFAAGLIDEEGNPTQADDTAGQGDTVDIARLPIAEVRKIAQDLGIDPTLHHGTLRKQVQELVHAQVRAD